LVDVLFGTTVPFAATAAAAVSAVVAPVGATFGAGAATPAVLPALVGVLCAPTAADAGEVVALVVATVPGGQAAAPVRCCAPAVAACAAPRTIVIPATRHRAACCRSTVNLYIAPSAIMPC
jgi:hypothetical protein